MKKHLTKRRVVLAAAIATALAVVGGIAFAYFTASGSGIGNATVGSASSIELSSNAVSGLYPGGADVPVTVSIRNPGSGNQYVNQITGVAQDNGDCDGDWFEVDTIDYQKAIGPGATDTASTKVKMLESGGNQDACQGKTLTINWSSN